MLAPTTAGKNSQAAVVAVDQRPLLKPDTGIDDDGRPVTGSTTSSTPINNTNRKVTLTRIKSIPETAVVSKTILTKSEINNLRKRNINLMYCHVTAMTLYQSICCWNVFDAYLALLARREGSSKANTWVGAAESVTGLSTLIFAVPCGIFADNYDRTKIIRMAGVLGCIASCTSLLGFLYDSWHIIFLNMGLWGLFTSMMGTAAEAVFADSCPAGERSAQTATKGSLQTVGLALGPLIMYGVFKILGDEWTITTLHVPLIIGCLLGPLAALPCFFMQDVRNYELAVDVEVPYRKQTATNLNILRERGMTNVTINENTNELNQPASGLPMGAFGRIRGSSRAVTDHNIAAHRDDDISNLVTVCEELDIEDQIEVEEKRFNNMDWKQRCVPFVLTTADFITEVGAGMTVRFFPLFFISDFDVAPTTLSLIFGVYPALVALSIHICQQISVVTGRAQISWLFQACGICCLLGMVYVKNLPILVGVFFARSCFQNAAYPVDRSVLYDYIPSSKRGRWNSIASLTTMTWSGSAVIGGYITDGHDYRYTFVITAIIYMVGLAIYTPLLWLVPKEEAFATKKEELF